jgi:hypothetical protein
MLRHPLLDPVAVAGGGTPAPVPAKPTATPSLKPSAAPASAAASSAAAPATESASDDPFEPPKKPAPATAPAKSAAAPAAPDDSDRLAPKELRERYKAVKLEATTYGGKVKELEAKIASFEAQGKDTTALTGRLTAIEKERDAALAELRAAKQEASPEFKEKYEKPFNAYAERARKQVTELSIVEKQDDSGIVVQASRPATWADFTALYSLPTGKAIEQATAMFGASASYVLGLRDKLLDLDTTRQTALEDEKAQFKQRNEAEIANQAKERETIGKTWTETNTRLSESVADYKNDPEDTESNDARKHALAVFDSSVQAADRQDFINKKVLRDAHIRQRVGAYAVQKILLARKDEKIAALQAQVDELKGSAPGSVKRPGGGDTPAGEEDWAKGLKEAVTPE